MMTSRAVLVCAAHRASVAAKQVARMVLVSMGFSRFKGEDY